MATAFRSKIDAWLLISMLGAMAMAGFALAAIAISSAGQSALWAMAAGALVGFGLPAWILLWTRYTIDPPLLRIRCAPFRWRIPIAEISALTATRNPLSSPALSLDRLRIDYSTGRSLMISPREVERFVNELDSVKRGIAADAIGI